jgi:O-methyltransferase
MAFASDVRRQTSDRSNGTPNHGRVALHFVQGNLRVLFFVSLWVDNRGNSNQETTMSSRTIQVDETLHQYILDNSLREPELLQRLREETAQMPESNMQISPEQGQFMQLLLSLMGARRVIEVGTFTGYSALVMAQVLPEDGRIVACDLSDEWTAIARRYWQQAGVEEKVDLRIAPASGTLAGMIEAGESGDYDFAFIDADKTGYRDYYEKCLRLLRPGGLLAVDNTLWNGSVADPDNNKEDTVAIREFNAALHTDDRVDLSLVPIGDGLTLARKR